MTTTTYTLELRDDGGSNERITLADRPTGADIRQHAREWAEQGDWGDDGAMVAVYWTLLDGDDDELDSGHCNIAIEPDTDALVQAAGGDTDCEHDWIATYDVEGGCRENPGVWSTGGTSMTFRTHCRHCGLMRTERHYGSQRNPGQMDTTKYELPSSEDLERMGISPAEAE